uniref:Cytochrome P450 n=1 Tax=Kalanchoe fedtschenkoi TaxID=63787 RepID=A0A7N0VF01_KALFE
MEAGSFSTLKWVTWILGSLPFLWLLFKWWNEILYVFPVSFRSRGSGAKLPPGGMGIPFLGELITFLWYFKFIGRPDDFINSKRKKYGGDGVFKTHLFGSPSIISVAPAFSKFVMQNIDDFRVMWPTEAVMGSHSLIAVHGKPYERIRKLVGTTANDPKALRRIVIRVQPRVVAGLESWAEKGRVSVHHEVRKVVFENIGRLFVSLDPGPLLDELKLLFSGVMEGVRANPINFPGTAFHHALKCKKRLEDIFYANLEEKKNQAKKNEADYDLMDGLMNIQDEEGNKLSDEEVVDNTVALVFAGFESTSTASMWAVYYLAKYPNVLKKLRVKRILLFARKRKAIPSLLKMFHH